MKIVVAGDGILAKEFKKYDFIVKTISLNDTDFKVFDEYDTIINTYNRSEKDELGVSGMYMYNAEIPSKLSDYCEKTGKKFVHISTGDLYENSVQPQNELCKTYASNNYEATKLLGEQYCNNDTLILRPKNMFNSTLDQENTLYQYMKSTSNIDIPISFTHTLDVIRSTTKLLIDKQSGVFNIACNGTLQPFKVAPSPEYLRKTTISELQLTNNAITVLDTTKLFKHHITEDCGPKLLECFAEIIGELRT